MWERKEVRYVIGLMSGTSVDGIDAAVIEIAGDPYEGKIQLLEFENKPFPEAVRAKIFELFDTKHATVDKVGYLNVLLGELYARAAEAVIKKAGLTFKDIDCIGSHGQTIYHHPETCNQDGYPFGYTVQIGEGAVIANRTGIPCVSDFRVADMAVGGQGAPLVPFTEYILYRKESKTILLQNIGGIGNITVLPAGCSVNQIYAFDTGPGNMIIDGLVSRYSGGTKTMDEGGHIAGSGRINGVLLQELCSHGYFDLKPPKSTGRELFGAAYIDCLYAKLTAEGILQEDAIATVTDYTAWSIQDSYRKFILPTHAAQELVIGGGGSYNTYLVDRIRTRLKPYGVQVRIQEELGYNSDAKEAIAFALLADCTMQGKCNNVPSVTGAERPVIMGKISL